MERDIDREMDNRTIAKYERMLDVLYKEYMETRRSGVFLTKDSEIVKRIQRGEMLVEEMKRQRDGLHYSFGDASIIPVTPKI